MQSPNHWSGEGVVHEYGEHARHTLHAQGRFELQLGPQKNLRPQVQKKKKLNPQCSVGADDYSQKAYDTSMKAAILRWSFKK